MCTIHIYMASPLLCVKCLNADCYLLSSPLFPRASSVTRLLLLPSESSMSSYYALPFLVINYGTQMVFILQQRLQAQSVTQEKSSRVLSDVIRSLFAPEFTAELMRPQPLYTPSAVRDVFDKLAQSSIMRLSPNSMDKLYDLMTMGVKQMLVTSRFPTDLVEGTMNHLDEVVAAISGGPDAEGVNPAAYNKDCKVKELAAAIEAFRVFAGNLSVGELASVRSALLTFFQSKRVKVSLFLQEKRQNSDGTFNVPYGGPMSMHETNFIPGTFRYFEGTGAVVAEVPYSNVHLAAWQPAPAVPGGGKFNPFNVSHRSTAVGRNIYMADRKKAEPIVSSSGAGSIVRTDSSSTGSPVSPSGRGRPPATTNTCPPVPPVKSNSNSASTSNIASAKGSGVALNTLVSMLSTSAGSGSAGTDNPLGASKTTQFIRISNLFGEEDEGADGQDAIGLPSQQVVKISAISREEAMKANRELTGVIFGLSTASGAQQDEDDDLLTLMDKA